MTLRKALRRLRLQNANQELPPQFEHDIDLDDGGQLQIRNVPASHGGVLLGCYKVAHLNSIGRVVRYYRI